MYRWGNLGEWGLQSRHLQDDELSPLVVVEFGAASDAIGTAQETGKRSTFGSLLFFVFAKPMGFLHK